MSNLRFIHLFVSVGTHGFWFYSVGCNPLTTFIVMLKLCHMWLVGDLSFWLLYSFDMCLSFFEHFLTSQKIFQVHLSLPYPWNNLFLEETLVLVSFSGKMAFQSRDLGASGSFY